MKRDSHFPGFQMWKEGGREKRLVGWAAEQSKWFDASCLLFARAINTGHLETASLFAPHTDRAAGWPNKQRLN